MIRITNAWVRLIMALVIGSLISAPVVVSNVRTLSVLRFCIGSCPINESELQDLISNQKHVCTVTVNRDHAIADHAMVTVRIVANHLSFDGVLSPFLAGVDEIGFLFHLLSIV